MTNAAEEDTNLSEGVEETGLGDDEDDYTGYFLEPIANSVSIVERIAEANRKLYEEGDPQNLDRPKKVQFSESLVNIEPETYESDEFAESDENTGSEGEREEPTVEENEITVTRAQRPKTASRESKSKNSDVRLNIPEDIPEEISAEEIATEEVPTEEVPTEEVPTEDVPTEDVPTEDVPTEDVPTEEVPNEEVSTGEVPKEEVKEEAKEDPQQMKVLLVMLPREQSSSCESVIGEEVQEEKKGDKPLVTRKDGESNQKVETVKPVRANRILTPSPCKVSKISPDLNCSPKAEAIRRERKQVLKCKKPKNGKTERPRSSVVRQNKTEEQKVPERPKTATEKRSCCVAKTGLPKYNGLRSEYGLSAEQLQEKRMKTFELRQQKRMDRVKKKQEEIRKRVQNEENFSQWLYSKRRGATVKRPVQVDTLSRSDVYIQTHAMYASRRGVSYSVEYGLGWKKYPKSSRILLLERKREKSINLERLFDNVTPHVKKIYRIYLGNSQTK